MLVDDCGTGAAAYPCETKHRTCIACLIAVPSVPDVLKLLNLQLRRGVKNSDRDTARHSHPRSIEKLRGCHPRMPAEFDVPENSDQTRIKEHKALLQPRSISTIRVDEIF